MVNFEKPGLTVRIDKNIEPKNLKNLRILKIVWIGGLSEIRLARNNSLDYNVWDSIHEFIYVKTHLGNCL